MCSSNSETTAILETILRLLIGRQRLLVAFSGGVDSTVLLHAITTLKERTRPDLMLRALHINHGLSPHAKAWEQHCYTWCKQRNIPMESLRVHFSTAEKGVEAAARDARYHAFTERLQPQETLVLGHHLDDQCETFLLALKRGSGPTGLSAMPQKIAFAAGELLRPLLSISRAQLEVYANTHQLSWIEDESNQDIRYERNFLRQQVLPIISQRWPHFTRAVSKSAGLCAEQESLLDELLTDKLTAAMGKQSALSIAALQNVSEQQRKALLRRWFAFQRANMPTSAQLEQLWHSVVLSKKDAMPMLQYGSWQIRRFQNYLHLSPILADLTGHILPWDPIQPLILPDKLGWLNVVENEKSGVKIRAPAANEQVTIRFGVRGVIRIVGRQHSRSIKKLWQELHIPPWLRNRIPLIYYNERLITALGAFITEEGKVTQTSSQWCVEWIKKE